MPDLNNMPCWFLGANAPKGYYSRFDQLFFAFPRGKCFLLKGGPGTGKSTMLKKFASVLSKKGLSTELIFCSADTDSLDAVITSDGSFVMADATLPHSVEPKYPGVYETSVSLSDCWNEEMLNEHSLEIISLFEKNRKLHEETRRYISAAASLFDEAARLETESVYKEKIEKCAVRICFAEFKKGSHIRGTEKQRFLSAVTDKGVFFFSRTPKILCDRIYAFEDEAGAASRIFMSTVRKIAIEHGLDIITCKCPIFPDEKIEHIFIPSLRLGFVTLNKRHPLELTPQRIIHSARFLDTKKYARCKKKIRFSLRFGNHLIDEAVNCMKEAKTVHDELESYYISTMDFSKADEKFKEILKTIL